MKQVGISIFAALLAFFLFVAPANAESVVADKPLKESLLAAWEAAQKENPYTVTFEKTAEKDTYNFETSIFPFKGKLKVLNELIDVKPSGYYGDFRDYDEKMPAGDYIGIVELQLDGIDKEFSEKFAYSYRTWEQGNVLYFNAETKQWYTEAQWAARKDALKDAALPKGGRCTSSATGTTLQSFGDWLKQWGPACVLIGLWLWGCFVYPKKIRAKQEAIQAQFMAISEESLAISKQSRVLQEESQARHEQVVKKSLALSEEALAVNKEILEALKRKV